MKKHDFDALFNALVAASTGDYDPTVPQSKSWQLMYPAALDEALNQGNFGQLMGLLREGEPLHPMLLPALADAIQSKISSDGGKRPLLNFIERRGMRTAYRAELVRVPTRREPKRSAPDTEKWLAERYGVSISTVRRVLGKKK